MYSFWTLEFKIRENGSESKMVVDPYRDMKNGHHRQADQKIRSDFPPAVPKWRYSPLHGGNPPKMPFCGLMGRKFPMIEVQEVHLRVDEDTLNQYEKPSGNSSAWENKIKFPLAVPHGQFSLKIGQIGLFPLKIGQNEPYRNMGTARGKLLPRKMTARWMLLIE